MQVVGSTNKSTVFLKPEFFLVSLMGTMREYQIQESIEFLHHHRFSLGNPNGNSFLQKISLVLLVFLLTFSGSRATAAFLLTEKEQHVVKRFQSYLQINTSHPDPDYAAVNKFLIEQGEQIELDIRLMEFTPMKPVLLFTWKASDASLPSIILNSHTDVVPSEETKWEHSPFGAHMDEEGKIFARGSQDMKCVGMQYLEAIRNLRAAGFKPRRSLHVSFVPDEELGGDDGAKKFYQSDEFKELDVAFVLDEGIPSLDDVYHVANGEKSVWWFVVKASGSPAHGSRLFDGMAVHNLRETLNKIEEFRTREFEKLKSGKATDGEVVSVNNVFLKAGTATPTGFVMNLQPSEAEAGFDMRVPPFADPDHLEKLIMEEWAPASRNLTVTFSLFTLFQDEKDRWSVTRLRNALERNSALIYVDIRQGGQQTDLFNSLATAVVDRKFIMKQPVRDKLRKPLLTPVDDTNPWWARLKTGVANAGGKLGKPQVLMGATDCRYARLEGLPAFGFSPMANTPFLLHDHNEFLPVQEYLKGITVYEEIIKSLTGPDEHTANTESSKHCLESIVDRVHTEL